jgi:phosphomannomutase
VRLVEAELERLEPVPDFRAHAPEVQGFDIRAEYYDALSRVLDLEALRTSQGVLYHDAMGGAGAGWLEAFARRAKLRVEVRPVHGVPNPTFYGVNPEPIPQNLESLTAVLAAESGRTFGAVTDGDADRVGAVLAGGEYFNSHQIFAVLLDHLHRRGGRGRVVKTYSGSHVIDRLAASRGLEVLETPIGFKYITDAFLEGDADAARRVLIGGEESGGMAVDGHIPERDGLLNSLLLLEAVATSGKSLKELFEAIELEAGVRHAYDRVDLHVPPDFDRAGLKDRLWGVEEVAGRAVAERSARDGVKFRLSDDAWVLFRASGTEPVVRVYSEAPSPEEVRAILADATRLVGV